MPTKEEGVGFPGTKGTGCCELPDLWVGNLTLIVLQVLLTIDWATSPASNIISQSQDHIYGEDIVIPHSR